jgi:hypothetical protein
MREVCNRFVSSNCDYQTEKWRSGEKGEKLSMGDLRLRHETQNNHPRPHCSFTSGKRLQDCHDW